MNQILNPTTNIKTNALTERSSAVEAAADAFGNNYIRPADREFVDRQPSRRSERLAPRNWHKLGDVVADVLHDVAGETDKAA